MKRAWMLLLAVIALVALMTIPAMAAETHEHGTCLVQTSCAECQAESAHTDWQTLAVDTVFVDGGKYVVPAGFSAGLTVDGKITVTICLNGNTWEGVESSNTRPLTVSGGATVNIVDCSARTNYVSAGQINGVDLTDAGTVTTSNDDHYGGALFINGSTVNFYNGTITGGCAYRGGNIYLKSGAFKLLGGVLTGTNSTSAKWSTVSGYNAAIYEQGGIVYNAGGNMYIASGTFTVGSAALQGTDLENVVPQVSGGCNVFPGTSSKPNGGSIFSSGSGVITLYSGTISGGRTVNGGGNIYTNGRINMSGGLITGGLPTSSGSANIFSVNGDLYLSGGQIDGYIGNTNTSLGGCKIVLSGSIKVLGTGMTLGYSSSDPAVIASELTLNDLNDDAKIHVKNVSQPKAGATKAVSYTNTSREKLEELVAAGILCPATGSQIIWRDVGISFHPTTEVWHCYCSNIPGNAEHKLGCCGYDVKWTAWSGKAINADGYYYINKSMKIPSGSIIESISGNLIKCKNQLVVMKKNTDNTYTALKVVFDLNGCNIDNQSTRALQVWYSDFTLCNTAGTDGIISAAGNYRTDKTDKKYGDNYQVLQILGNKGNISINLMDTVTLKYVDYHGGKDYTDHNGDSKKYCQMGFGITSVGSKTTLNVYGATLMGDINGDLSLNAGVLAVEGGIVNIYPGSKITGGKVKTDNTNVATEAGKGGAIYVASGTLNMYGGTVTGGNASFGGAIYVKAGTVNLSGGTIQAGQATEGGTIYNAGTMTVTNVDITGGTAATNGGAIYNKGTITMNGVDITGGTAALGGAVYSEGGTINYYDGTVKNGQAREGGNFYVKNCTLNMISNPAGAGTTDARKIQNGIAQASGSGVRGGNIRLEGKAVVKLQGVEVSGGQATQRGETKDRYAYGGNIYMSSGTTLELLSGTKVTGGKTSSKLVTTTDGQEKESNMWSPGGNIMMDGGSLTITDAEISGAETNSDGQSLYINSGATVVMNSGKIECSHDGYHSVHMQGGNFTIKGGELLVTEGTKNVRNISSNNKYAGSLTIEGGTISGGNMASGDGGNIRLCAKISLTITGGTISGGKAPAGNGGNIWLQGSGKSEDDADNGAIISNQSFTLSGGTIKDGEAKNGGNIFLGSTGDMTMTGGNIQDGTANGGAGNLYMLSNSSLVMSSGIISGGFTNGGNGGNIYSATGCTIDFSGDAAIKNGKSEKNSGGSNGNGANIALYGTLTMTGGSILQEASNRENWEGDGGNVYMNSQGGRAILKGGTINGWFFVADYSTIFHYPSVTLGGDIQIKNDTAGSYSLYLLKRDAGKVTENEVEVTYPKTWAMITIDGLTADAEVGLTCQGLAAGEMRVITTNAAGDLAGAEAWQSCFYNDFTGNVIGITADNKLFMAKAAIGATVSGGDICYEMPAAIAKAGQNGMIQLQSNYNGEMTIPSGVWVDLNGKTLAGKVTVTGGDLHLIDSLSADYNLEQDENKNYIYGKLTATVDGTVEDSFTTLNQNGYIGNHRYIVLVDKDEDGNMTYHAHRIYLAVKGVVLYPQGPHLRYHTEFKCDQVVAKDAKYGVQISGIPYDATEAKTSTKLYSAAVAGAGESNSRIAGLTNILVNEDAEVCNYLATMNYTACGYISVNGQEFTSASYTTTLKAVVEGVDKMWGQDAEGVTETIKPALVEMYETYADIMGGWELTNIKAAAAAKKQ